MALAHIDPADRSRPELLQLTLAQRAIWWDLRLWCVESENDGVWHTDAIRTALHVRDGRTALAAVDAIQRVGLIEPHPDRGPGWYIIPDFLKHQMSREARAQARSSNATRQDRWRKKHTRRAPTPTETPPDVTRYDTPSNGVTNGVSNGTLPSSLLSTTWREEGVTPVDAASGVPALTDRGSAGPPRVSQPQAAGVPALALDCLPIDSAVRAAMKRIIDGTEPPPRLTVINGGGTHS